jgi:hypothetical protein
MRRKPKVPRSWLKDPLFARPKREHARHPFGRWDGGYPARVQARACTVENCRCMHWCCYQQRRARSKP